MRRSTSLTLVVVLALALTMVFASMAFGANKPYTATIASFTPPVTAGQSEVFTFTIQNKTLTQSLGSCNLTMNGSLTGLSVVAGSGPSTGTVTLVGSIFQMRNLSTPPMGTRSFRFNATVPAPGSYLSAVECRQSNAFNPSNPSNQFTLTQPSNLTITASPQADLAVATTAVTPQPVIGGNTVSHTITLTNNGPAGSGRTVTLSDSVSGSGSISSIFGPAGWTCGGSGASASCSRTVASGSAMAPAESAAFEVRVLASAVSSSSSFTNTASVSQSAESVDPTPGNNTSAVATTVNPGSSSGSGFVSNVSGGCVITEAIATAINGFVGSVCFPGQEGATGGGFIYSLEQIFGETCALLPCTIAMRIDDILAAYDNPLTEAVEVEFVCDATRCSGTGENITMFERDETGNQSIILPCNILGIADPAPCVNDIERIQIPGPSFNDLRISMLFLAGDPRVAGLCFGSC